MRVFKELKKFDEWSAEDRDLYTVNVIKGLILDGVRKANSGHTGGPLSSADMAYILFSEFLKYYSDDPDWIARDRFVLSAGHESMLLYSLLFLQGFLTIDDLMSFRKLNSRTPGHPEVEVTGADATTGPLGQGMGMAVGMALAEIKLRAIMDQHKPGSGVLFQHFTYVLAGDGDLQEPISLGAAALAGHWKLNKLITLYDSNKAQISGMTDRADSTDLALVFEGLGWHVQAIDGHDHDEIRDAIQTAKVIDRPSIIIGSTVMAKGSATMEGDFNTHGVPLPQDEINLTKENLGLPADKFFAPQVIIDYFNRRSQDLMTKYDQWNNRLKEYQRSKKFQKIWTMIIDDDLPTLTYPDFEAGTTLATRKAFGKVLDSFAEQLPHLIGGSADLEPSNYTGGFAKTFGDFTRDNPDGRNLAFGVREFPMAAILNGLSLHGGLIPFGGTFLVFADYERPALRLAALQKLRVIHEFTHDSFFVGEDGPTHQPVEHIMSLRIIPNFTVFRPADALETAVCFKLAIKNRDIPSALLLSRQGLPVMEKSYSEIEKGVRKGAYTIKVCDEPAEILLIATGSEVALAVEVADLMKDRRVRVVSMPSWELFDSQRADYRARLIPPRGCLKVSIEAGVTLGWERYVGSTGLSIGLDKFGVSAPAEDLARKFGFTAENIVKKINNYLETLL
jgi:transketolase